MMNATTTDGAETTAEADTSVLQPRPSLGTSSRTVKTYTTPDGEVLERGTVILAPYKNRPKWPAVVRTLPSGKTNKTVSFFYLPFYKGEGPFKRLPKELDVFKAEMNPPDGAEQDVFEAYELARSCLLKTPEERLDIFANPPEKPQPPPKEPKKSERGQPAVKREYADSENEEHDEGHEDRKAARCKELMSEEEAEESDEEESADDEPRGPPEPLAKRHRRQLDANEVVFFGAQPTRFQSVDQVVLIVNPHGNGLWPAQPVVMCEEKSFANFHLFPRNKKKKKDRVAPAANILRTCDTRMWTFDERRLNAMLEFTKARDSRLHRALADVRAYLTEHSRFDEEQQDATPFDEAATIHVVNVQKTRGEDGETDLSLDELTISASVPGAEPMTTKNVDSLIHKRPTARAREAARIEEKFATARQLGDLKPTWLIRHRIYRGHNELTGDELQADDVKEHFERVWKGQQPCNAHELFLKCVCGPQKTWFPSSYRVHASTGGIISAQTMDEVFKKYMEWMKLGTSLPKMSYLEQFRYVMEIMFHEACIFVLQQKYDWDRKRADEYIRDGQDYAFGLERGHRNQQLRDRLYPDAATERRPTAPKVLAPRKGALT
ncbi:hypothetical protein M3Y99_01009500 [Aphelenchoides fujianensis]|nr:hypothetical protein M3Y99_01009500 [Aphelenchoides fujianensis]